MTRNSFRLLAAGLALESGAWSVTSALARAAYAPGGNWSFGQITATGGTLSSVDVSGATVQMNGVGVALSAVAAQAAGAVPMSMAGQPKGWLQLDGSALVPSASLPASVTSPIDSTARVAAAAAQSSASSALTLASSAVPVAKANLANGWLQLNASGLIPTATMPPSGVTAGACAKAVFDATGRATGCTTLAGGDIPVDGSTIAVNASGLLSALGGGGVDPTARSLATNAQAVAAAAIPASQIGVTVAGLDAAKSLSGNISAAASDAVQRTFAQHWSDTINAADYGVDCDAGIVVAFSGSTGSNTITSTHYVFGPADVGRPLKGGYQWGQWTATVTGYGPVVAGVSSATVSTPPPVNATGDAGYMTYVTDNSAAMQAVYKHYLASPKGAMVSWPIGKCNFSQAQTWNVPTSLRFTGMGIGATQFVMTAPGTDAFHFIVGGSGNQPDLTLDNFSVSKSDPNQNFTQDQTANRFANKAINVEAANDTAGNAGILVVSHVMIEGQNHNDTSHGWNVGLEVNSFARPVIEYVNVKNAGIADGWNNAYVNAPNPLTNEAGAIPAAILPGQGDDFWLHGSPSNNGTVAVAAAAGTATIPVGAGASIVAGNGVEDVALNQTIGTAYSVSSKGIVLNATTATAAAAAGASTVTVTANGGNANLQSGSITDVTTSTSLGSATLSGTTLTFGAGGIASAVSNGDVLSSGASLSVSSGDELSNSSSFVIDSAFEHDGSDGGNVGLDIEDFQGGYVTDYDAVYSGYEIRSEHNDPTSTPELMEVENSLFNGFVSDIDVANTGWFGIANNDFLHSFNAPFFQAIWNHGGGLWTITGNQLSAPGQANASGIAFTSDGPDSFGGFPESVSGNVGFSFTGTCLYTDAHYSAVIASSNSFEGCGTYVTDSNGSNDYANNIFQYPTMQWTPQTGTEFPAKVLMGTYANAGVLTVQDFPTNFAIANQFVIDSSQGTMTETMNRTHAQAWGGFFGYSGPGTLALATGTNSTFPPVTSGNVEIYGRLFCANASAFMAGWSVLGHYNTSGPSGGGVFTPDTDSDTLYAVGGSNPRFSLTPQLMPGTSPGIEVVIGPGTPAASCTAKLDELVAQ